MQYESPERNREFYTIPAVRQRIVDFLGGESPGSASCYYITSGDATIFNRSEVVPASELTRLLETGEGIARSLWDQRAMIAHMDIEYVNFDFKAEPYLDRERSFTLQEPVIKTIVEVLGRWEIEPLRMASGRGYHLVWSISYDSHAFRQLVMIGQVPSSLHAVNARPHPPLGVATRPEVAKAFAGLGLIMEYIAFQVKKKGARHCRVPLEITAVRVGPIERGREIVSLDISEYGDPLHTRMIRVPFTFYRKHLGEEFIRNAWIREKIPVIIMIPVYGRDPGETLAVMQDYDRTALFAETAITRIPDRSDGTSALIEEYDRSEVKKFHGWYYSQEQHPPSAWAETYDMTPLDILPPCVRQILENPNDLLLKPAGIQLVVRSFMALGWHPRHIAGLIRSKFEREFGWGDQWLDYDPSSRADFYTRLFSGLFVNHIDDLVDFNCLSTGEKQLCFVDPSSCGIDAFKTSLLRRRKYARLGRRPFNRLFL